MDYRLLGSDKRPDILQLQLKLYNIIITKRYGNFRYNGNLGFFFSFSR